MNLTVPLTTWLGLASEPGEAAGLGPLDAGICRDLATALAATKESRWCLTLTGPDGRAVAHGCAPAGPPPPGTGPPPRTPPAGPAGTRPAGPPGAQPPGAAPPGTGPPRAGPAGTGPPRSDYAGAGSPGTGPPRNSHARTGPPRDRPSASRPPGTKSPASAGSWLAGARSWLAGIPLATLETGTCTHPRQTTAYRPGPALRHLITIRDRTCYYPTCRRPATHCDQDHTIPYDQGGRTCECDLGPGCRRHHKAKQAPGWHLDQPEPGRFILTLPNGRQITTTPGHYPLP